MTLDIFIHRYDLSPMVPLKVVYKLTNRGHSTIYDMNRRGEIEIQKIGSRSFVDVETVHRLACEMSSKSRLT